MGLKDIFNASNIKEKNERLKKRCSELEAFDAPSIKQENERLKKLFSELGASDAVEISRKIKQHRQFLKQLVEHGKVLQEKVKHLEATIQYKKAKLIVIDEQTLLEEFALYIPKFSFQTSEEYRKRLDLVREGQKTLIKNKKAVDASEEWTVNGNKSEGMKMVNDMKKLLLRSFNNECDYCVNNVKFNNIESSENRIEKSYVALNNLGRIMQAKISEEYKKLKFDELYLAYEYQQRKQEEKEEQKRAREELREQQKLEQEIRQARERIAKEKRHYIQAIKVLEQKLTSSSTDSERAVLTEKLHEVRLQYSELEKEEKIIDYREKNAKAGYVYVISNIGAFGDNVYKIGMTRRLEPMDRVDELGDASVPFSFDVHALIFSENAPSLEAKLHEHFYHQRINKLNNRKEFFRADINEIEKIVRENYDKVVDIVKQAPAEQYRESLRVN